MKKGIIICVTTCVAAVLVTLLCMVMGSKHLELTDTDKAALNTILERYITLGGGTPIESETSDNSTDLVVGGAVCDFLEMVMVKGKIYYGTGEESTALRCGVMDGQIDSTVGKGEMPTKNNESNFGTGYGYQYGGENTVEVCVDGKWWIFSCAGEDTDGVSEVDGQVDEADATAGTDEDEASDTDDQDTADSDDAALLRITSDGHTAAAYEIFASSYSWSELGWLCACGLDPATELSKIAEQLPEFTYSEDFAIEIKANAQLLEPMVYDKNFERLEAVTDLADLEPGKYYVCYGVEEKGRYIETEKQYEITTYYCVFELIFSMANAKIG